MSRRIKHKQHSAAKRSPRRLVSGVAESGIGARISKSYSGVLLAPCVTISARRHLNDENNRRRIISSGSSIRISGGGQHSGSAYRRTAWRHRAVACTPLYLPPLLSPRMPRRHPTSMAYRAVLAPCMWRGHGKTSGSGIKAWQRSGSSAWRKQISAYAVCCAYRQQRKRVST